MNLLHETILITVSLHADGISHETLTLLTKHHGFDEVEILDAIELLIKRRRLGVNKELKLTCLEQVPEEIPAGYLAAAEKYKESKKATFWDWFCGIFDRIKFALALFIITTFFAIGLAAQEMPSWILPGMLHVETSSRYGSDGIIYRNQKRGKAGEVGCFQALPATLRQFKFSPSLFEQDTKYAEAATVIILTHYYNVTGSWTEAVGAWNCGLGRRKTQTAIDYTNSVKNAGER